jgi:hypothetical protein
MVLVLASEKGAKWFLMVVAALLAGFAGLVFRDHRLYGIWLLAACLPIAIQYPLFPGPNGSLGVSSHSGGALDEPMVNLVDFPIALLVLFWLVDLGLGTRRLPPWTKLDSGVVLFLWLCLASMFNTTEYALLVMELVRYLKYFLLYFVVRTYVVSPMYVWGVTAIGILMLVPQSLIALIQYLFYFRMPIPVGGVVDMGYEMVEGEVITRVTGLVGHCNTFAVYLTIPLSWALIVAISRIPVLLRILTLPLFVLGTGTLVITYSRNGWLTLAFLIAVVTLLGLRLRRVDLAPLLGFGVLMSFVLGAIAVSPVAAKILARLFDPEGKAIDSRWDLFAISLEMMREYPIFGIGLNSFEENMSAYDFTGVTNQIQKPVHNVFCLVASETGLPSLLVLLALWGGLTLRAWRLVHDEREHVFLVGAIGVCACLGLGLASMFDIPMRKEPILGLAALIAGMVMAVPVPAEKS